MQQSSRWNDLIQPYAGGLALWIHRAIFLWICFSAGQGFSNDISPMESSSNLLSIAELQNKTAEQGRAIESFQIKGVVCAVIREKNSVILQDASATALFELPSVDDALGNGDTFELSGDRCALTRSRFGIQLGTAPIVDNNGAHAALEKSGGVFLNAGRCPVRLLWFNREAPGALIVEYQGPELPRQRIPSSLLWRSADSADGQRGLAFAAYTGGGWYSLPDFAQMRPITEGIATNFNVSHRSGSGNTAIVFNGFLQVERAGLYTFFVESADGCQLFIGNPAEHCTLLRTQNEAMPGVTRFDEIFAEAGVSRWTQLEGVVNFVGQADGGTELEISTRTETIQATVLSGHAGGFTNLLHRHVRAVGLCETSRDIARNKTARLLIPTLEQVEVVQPTDAVEGDRTSASALLTTAGQVQRLKPTEAEKRVAVKLKGVVTQASPTSLVLQDFTGGVFIHYSPTNWTGQPRIGDLWQIDGATDPGDFSPVVFATNGIFLGAGTLPEPIQPTWDQLLNGSLDAQYVELQGVVTAVSQTGMVVLTRNGKLKVVVDELRRSYADGRDLFVQTHIGAIPVDVVQQSYVGSVVRIRGCLVAVWNAATRQVQAGEIRLVAAVVNVEESRPADPFVLETRNAADLLLFDPHANALQRTKVAGQIVYARPREYCIQDNQTGIRAVTEETLSLEAGDLVEAVGFPQLSGAGLELIEAQVRKTGERSLPAANLINSTNLLDRRHDSTLVELEAILLSDTVSRNQRVLELQAGSHRFLARLDSFRPAWGLLADGSRLRLTGVYTSVGDRGGNGSLDPFELQLNRVADIVVLQKPSWWTVRHALAVIATLAIGLGLALVWITLLRKKVEERTAQLQKEIEERQIVERHRAIDQERTRVAQDLHDELGAGLTEVSILGSLAKTQTIPAETKERYVDQLTNVARSLVTALDEIVWAVNPQYDSVASLATYYSLFAQRFLNLAGIACRLKVTEKIPDHLLDSRLRHGIFRAFKEALNNVVRHSGATEVRLGIEVSAEQLKLSVTDNGCGFNLHQTEPGADGLKGMRERMNNLGGVCEVVSEPGGGTSVELRLPLKGNNHDQGRDSRR